MFKQLECFILLCDICRVEAEQGDEFVPHYPADLKGEAEEQAENADWTVWDGHHRCPECRLDCSSCNHMFGEHDYGEGACEGEDCSCQEFTVGEGG